MNDAIVLIAMSQIICLGAIAYLYWQLQALRQGSQRVRAAAPRPMRVVQDPASASFSAENLEPRSRPEPQFTGGGRSADTLALLSRLQESGMDIPALARRMRRSEEEVRLLLRRQGAGR